jgi:uncharacterized integral membrane protein (TIGR00697 family)
MKAHHFLIAVAAMAAIIAGSNYLVQFPVHATLGGINLADLLTYAAFTFPVAFLVTDLTNKLFGPAAARKVVFAGFRSPLSCRSSLPPRASPLRRGRPS